MTRIGTGIFGGLAVATIPFGFTVRAQVNASSGGVVVQGNATNTTIRTGFTRADLKAAIDPLMVRNGEQEKTIRSLERDLGVNTADLRSIARAFGKGDVPDDQIVSALIKLAGEYKATKADIGQLPVGSEVKAVAAAALDNGDFVSARDLAAAGALARSVLAGVRYEYVPRASDTASALKIRDVRFLDDWPDRNLVWVKIPQLTRLAKPFSTDRVRFHRQAANELQQAFAEIESRALLNEIRNWCGSLSARSLPFGRSVSAQALGLAFDVNCGAEDSKVMDNGRWVEIVRLFQKHGFAWGGGYKVGSDPSHFQASRLADVGSAQDIAP